MVTKEATKVKPFGIQIDHPRNCDVLLQSVPGQRLRSAIKPQRFVIDAKSGKKMIPASAQKLSVFPETPGMEIHINPEGCKYMINDPLRGNEKLLREVQEAIKELGMYDAAGRIDGVKKLTGTLDVHRFKTLCREMHRLVEAGEAVTVKGNLPSLDDIEAMDGHFLLNPGSQVQNLQPRYERDLPAYVERLSKGG